MRLGLYGGTFDPVHYGHLVLADCCREQCELDEIWFVPAGDPPHKEKSGISPGEFRAEMLEFAVAGYPEFSVDRMELKRSGKSYTVDTLQALVDEDSSRELFFLMGADSLTDLPTWREPARIAELATIVAVNRGRDALPARNRLAESLSDAVVERIVFVSMPAVDYSSSEIRRAIEEQRSIRFRTPRAVEAYIRQKGLYGESPEGS